MYSYPFTDYLRNLISAPVTFHFDQSSCIKLELALVQIGHF